MSNTVYRAWDTKENKMIEDFTNYAGMAARETMENVWNQDRYIREIFIGLHDKNRKRIFKGDIVEFSYCNNVYKAEVVYNNKTCGFEVRYFTVVGVYGERALHSINFANIESIKVIGNIHNNPGLIYGK